MRYDHQAEVFFEWIEIAIVVKKREAPPNAEGRDPAIYSFAHLNPLGAELSIIDGASNRVLPADLRVSWKVSKMTLERTKNF